MSIIKATWCSCIGIFLSSAALAGANSDHPSRTPDVADYFALSSELAFAGDWLLSSSPHHLDAPTALSGANTLASLGVNYAVPDDWAQQAGSSPIAPIYTNNVGGLAVMTVTYNFVLDEANVATALQQPVKLRDDLVLTPRGEPKTRPGGLVQTYDAQAGGRALVGVTVALPRPKTTEADLGSVVILGLADQRRLASLAQTVAGVADSVTFAALQQNAAAHQALDGGQWMFENVVHSGDSHSGTVDSTVREYISYCGDDYFWRQEAFTNTSTSHGGDGNTNSESRSNGRFWIYGTGAANVGVAKDATSGAVTVWDMQFINRQTFNNGRRTFNKIGPAVCR